MENETPMRFSKGLLLGRPLGVRAAGRSPQSTVGFRRKNFSLEGLNSGKPQSELKHHRGTDDLRYDGEGHLITIAPTGSGKGRSAIIPNLLSYEGPIVVTDPKGENYAVTSRARRALGHSVYKLDPFHIVDEKSDCLNPLDIFALPNSERETDAQMLADLLAIGTGGDDFDQFWHNSAYGLLSGIVAYIASLSDDPKTIALNPESGEQNTEKPKSTSASLSANRSGSVCTFSSLMKTLHSDDVVYSLAVVLDTIGKRIPPLAYREISSFLQKADKERSGVLSTVNSYLKAFNTERVLSTLDDSSFLLNDIMLGKPISIYIIIPPDKLKSHKALLRLWIGIIMKAITSRKVIPKDRTLLVIDECAQLGNFPFLESAITLCRGYGLQTWTFWQDLSQLKQLYEVGWPTMVNNCGILQCFGANNFHVAVQLAELIGIDYDDIRQLNRDEQIVVIDGIPSKCSKYDYREDADFRGRYDENPYYANK
jgi:type IV secretion system protein VirD4